jgi:Rod binding domain-containing protein
MDAAADFQLTSALLAARPAPKPAAMKAKTEAEADKVAKDFESLFIKEFMGAMFEGVKTDGPFDGGPGEQIFRSMMLDQYSKSIAQQGGFGLADAVKRQLLAAQENVK